MTFSILITINYEFEKKIILTTYVFKKNWKKVFMQFRNKIRHSFRYESGVWIEIEAKYDDEKLICRAILKCLKKFRFHFYEIRFVLKIDSKTLIAQFNRSSTNFSKSFMIWWIVWIRLFDFEVRHIKNKKKSAVKKLIQRFLTEKKKIV